MLFRSFTYLAVSAAVAFCFFQPNATQAKTIDGFLVKILPLPTFDRLPHPDSTTGIVQRYVGNNNGAVDPFYKLPNLQNVSPYLAIYPGASATFTFSPRDSIKFFWGTPDDFNMISFYSAGKLVGTLQGGDFQRAFGFSEGKRPFPIGQEDMVRIRSSTLFDTVVLSDETSCCFEFSIFRPY
jgi:hypothetical protein